MRIGTGVVPGCPPVAVAGVCGVRALEEAVVCDRAGVAGEGLFRVVPPEAVAITATAAAHAAIRPIA
jgi:hypothetical protein